jgi:GNAT superfamily N-acetyltransferase
MLPDTTVAELDGRAVGFCTIRQDELDHLFVDPPGRGSGAAARLVADAEARLAEREVHTAWLSCAIGNHRAARLYEKCGWIRVANMINRAETPAGPYPIETWRYEKVLAQSAS